jgi:hypothetical protein
VSIPAALLVLCRTLEDFARAADAVVEAVASRPDVDTTTGLLEQFCELRSRAATAGTGAKGCPVPTGSVGLEILAHVNACNARIRAGTEAAERIASYRQTVDAFGEKFVVHAISNLAAVASWPSAARLRNAFEGRPAVIVSAGPSLEKNVAELRRFEGKAVIIAVSHALRALHRAGIVPDMCITTDAQDLRYHFEGVPIERLRALLLGTSVHPALYELPAQRFVTFAANPMIDSWVYEGLEEDVLIPSAGSVATDAFSLATLWGCDPIILVGQDLSFPDGKCYAASGCDGETRMQISDDGVSGVHTRASDDFRKIDGDAPVIMRSVPGYYGGTVPTSFAFQKARTWFIDTVAAKRPDRSILNCTEGGAHIDGMEHVSLIEAAQRYAVHDVSVDRALEEAIGAIRPLERRKLTLRRVDEMLAALTRCTTHARECAALADRAKRRPDLLRKLAATEGELSGALGAVHFVSAMMQREIRVATEAGKRASTVSEGLDVSLRMYEAVMRVVGVIRAPLAQARKALARQDLRRDLNADDDCTAAVPRPHPSVGHLDGSRIDSGNSGTSSASSATSPAASPQERPHARRFISS